MLANGKYQTTSGTSVAWDFVELPSQIMENFAEEPEVLRIFARHYQTGEVIPQEYIDKIRASSNFMAGLANMRQVGLGMIDMAWHSTVPNGETVVQIEEKADVGAKLYPKTEGTSVSTAFSHIFAGAIRLVIIATNGPKYWMPMRLSCSKKRHFQSRSGAIFP